MTYAEAKQRLDEWYDTNTAEISPEFLDCCYDALKKQIANENGKVIEDKYLTLIDSKEFQAKILEFISSEELDKFFNCTVFADMPECRQAMIHGMCVASMLTCKCEQLIAKRNDT